MAALPNIGFIGTGVMGSSMARHLISAGYPLSVSNRTKSKAQPLVDAGATWCDNAAAVAREADIVFTMLGYPADVESTYLGADGLIAAARPGTLLVDMTTSSPALAKGIAEAARSKECAALDAPVSGGDVGAREARLSIMVGGDQKAFERAKPLFERMGRNIVHHGEAGSGQHCKMANQIAIAANMIGVCEALVYARRSGLDVERVLLSISGGAAGSWSLSNLAPRILKGDFKPGFYLKHFTKDMRIALEESKRSGLQLPGLELALRLYEDLEANGEGNNGTQALFHHYAGD